ncbi:MAG: lasso peptide biosynthesis PqqD family chaperone [Spirochaetaceae bacterium]|nr:MAG: lasso peptide biosynthesis PqqD family chaperone [Spirochaetaceae bacterium]
MGACVTLETKVKASPDVISTQLDGETVLMHVSNGMYFGLNAVGSVIWETMKEPVTVDRLCDAVADEFEVERDVCENDVRELLAQLEEQGLVTVAAS